MKSENSYPVAIFGIPESEHELVERIFSVSQHRDNVYRIADETQTHTAMIALVDKTNADAESRYEQFHSQRQDFPTVVITDEKDPDSDYWVKRPFTAVRMLGALDRLVEDRLADLSIPQPTLLQESATEPETDTPTLQTDSAGTYTALVVDDSLPVRKQVSIALRRAGVTAEFAEDGESAIELIETREYDILFLDIVLPGKDGYEICRSVKRDKTKKHIPVVMLTSKSSRFDKAKGKLAGCDAYLTKPVSLKEFNETLSKWLNLPLADAALPTGFPVYSAHRAHGRRKTLHFRRPGHPMKI